MNAAPELPDGEVLVVPPGRPLTESAAWIGNACWAELRFHEVLTGWLAVEADDGRAESLWRLRAGAATRARRWHEHLPELREMPREGFVVPAGPEVEAWFAALEPAAASLVLDRLRADYEAHQAVAVGPADGPTAQALTEAIASVARDQVSLSRT